MTVIAWDGKTLAADRRRTVGGTPMQATKVRKVRDEGTTREYLVGCAGDSFDCVQFIDTFKFGEWDRVKPVDFAALIVDQDALIWFMGERPLVHQISLPRFAIGSGADYAIGAMAAGATALEAVRIASQYDIHCGDGADEVSF